MTVNNNISYRLMSEYLLDMSPEIYWTCIKAVRPLLEDERHIQTIFNYILKEQQGVFNTENAHFYLAVIYRIYSPIHLHTKDFRLKTGIRGIISNSFGYKNQEMINYFADTVLPHYKNPRWAAIVNKLAFDIVENIKNQLEDCK